MYGFSYSIHISLLSSTSHPFITFHFLHYKQEGFLVLETLQEECNKQAGSLHTRGT